MDEAKLLEVRFLSILREETREQAGRSRVDAIFQSITRGMEFRLVRNEDDSGKATTGTKESEQVEEGQSRLRWLRKPEITNRGYLIGLVLFAIMAISVIITVVGLPLSRPEVPLPKEKGEGKETPSSRSKSIMETYTSPSMTPEAGASTAPSPSPEIGVSGSPAPAPAPKPGRIAPTAPPGAPVAPAPPVSMVPPPPPSSPSGDGHQGTIGSHAPSAPPAPQQFDQTDSTPGESSQRTDKISDAEHGGSGNRDSQSNDGIGGLDPADNPVGVIE